MLACCRAIGDGDLRCEISPGTILLSPDGGVSLLADVVPTEFFSYVAPETAPPASAPPPVRAQLDGHDVWIVQPAPDPDYDWNRAAVFALGAILWELVAGRRLFRAATDYESMRLSLAALVPPLDGAPPGLDAIVRTALARDVGARYQRVSALGNALAAWLTTSAQA